MSFYPALPAFITVIHKDKFNHNPSTQAYILEKIASSLLILTQFTLYLRVNNQLLF